MPDDIRRALQLQTGGELVAECVHDDYLPAVLVGFRWHDDILCTRVAVLAGFTREDAIQFLEAALEAARGGRQKEGRYGHEKG